MRTAALTDIGVSRSANEDAYWSDSDRGIFAIADGMGGSRAGEIAAAIAIEIVSTELTLAVDRQLHDLELADALHSAFLEASEEIYQRGRESMDQQGMGCSLIAAIVQQGMCWVAYAGDTRAYLFYGGVLHQMTVDDTAVGVLVKRGFLLPEKVRSHAMKNLLLKSIGNRPFVEANLMKFPVKPQDCLLLCSDGLWGMVEDRAIEAIMSAHPQPEAACRELIRAARDSGGVDNITAIVVQVEEAAPGKTEIAR